MKTPSSKLLNVYSDDRGTFSPIVESVDPILTSNKLTLKRIYYVTNYGRGIIRGFHYHKKEWKFFIIVAGSAKFVALDPYKPKTIFTFTSSVRTPNLIVIPPGYANGWISLEDNTILFCCSTSTTKESIADDKRFDPYKWGDVWTVTPR